MTFEGIFFTQTLYFPAETETGQNEGGAGQGHQKTAIQRLGFEGQRQRKRDSGKNKKKLDDPQVQFAGNSQAQSQCEKENRGIRDESEF
ncbi:MAG TPA: hypothetical protein VL688_03265 [Verrucomicrobiae bacterium]|nr:hypothetical protein [Verrucomicrobiae bacterium]